MSRRVADLLIKIGADTYEFQQKTKQVEQGLSGISKKLTSVGKSLTMKLTAPLAALGGISVALADTQAKAEAKVQQAIKSTAGAAKLSFDELKSYASELQNNTLFGDEDILNNATAQLLTFTNIAGANFKRTQAVALDLSTVLDGDLKSASIQLGKALNDPVKNLSALTRSGIQFSEEQTTVIKNLAETGKLAEAQSVILDELERQYGGQAEAQAKVGAGAMVQLKNSWGDFLEQMGAAILPTLNILVEKLKGLVKWLNNLSPTTKKVITVIAGLAATVGPLFLTLGGIIKLLPILKTGIAGIVSSMSAATAVTGLLITSLLRAWELTTDLINSDEILNDEAKVIGVQLVNEGQWDVSDLDFLRRKVAELNSEYNAMGDGGNSERLQREITMWTTVISELEKKQATEKAFAAQSKKAFSDAEAANKELAKKFNNINNPIETSSGLILDLRNQIQELENSKLLPDATIEDIAKANAEIAKLSEELKKIENISLADLRELPAKVTPSIATTAEVTMDEPTDDPWSNFSRMLEVANQAKEKMKQGAKEAADLAGQIISTTQRTIASLLTNTFTDIGTAIAGDLGFSDLLKSIVSQVADFIAQLGSMLVTYGITMLAFQEALKEAFINPWLAIGVGLAMAITSALMQATISDEASTGAPALANGGLAYGATYAMVGDNPNASVDPEVIAPLSKLKKMIAPENNNNSTGEVVFKISGDSLKGILRKINRKDSRTNG